MNNANIGSASNVIGNPVNLIMSNATEDELKKYEGNLGLPSNALIIVNPLQNGTNIDDNWNDICMTDGNNGIKHIIPFTSVNTEQFEISSNNGNRTLSQRFPATGVDNNYFNCDNGILSVNNDTEFTNKMKQFNDTIKEKLSEAKAELDKFNNTASRYGNLIESLEKVADKEDIVTDIDNYINNIDKKLKDLKKNISNFSGDNIGIEETVDNVNEKFEQLSEVTKKVNSLENSIKDFYPEEGKTESAVEQKINEVINNANKQMVGIDKNVENAKSEYEAYKAKLDSLVDNTKAELHREYEALKDSLESCVNNNLMPLVEAQVDSCLANEKVASMLEGAVDKVLLNEFVEPCCTCADGNKYDQNGNKIDDNQTIKNSDVAKAITNTVAEAFKDPNMNIGTLNTLDKALGGDGDAGTASEAGSNVRDSISKIAADKAAVAVENVAAMVSQATQPKYVDKRFFRVMKLGEVDSDPSIPDSMKELPVLTFSKSLTEKILTLFTPGANEHGVEAF